MFVDVENLKCQCPEEGHDETCPAVADLVRALKAWESYQEEFPDPARPGLWGKK